MARGALLIASMVLVGCVAKPTDPVIASAAYDRVDYAALAECTYATWPLANQLGLTFTPFPTLGETRVTAQGGIEVGIIWTFRRTAEGAVIEIRSDYPGDHLAEVRPYADACAAKLRQA